MMLHSTTVQLRHSALLYRHYRCIGSVTVKLVLVPVGKSEFLAAQHKVVTCNPAGDIAVVASVIGLICITLSKERFEPPTAAGEIVADTVQEHIVVEIHAIRRTVGAIRMQVEIKSGVTR